LEDSLRRVAPEELHKAPPANYITPVSASSALLSHESVAPNPQTWPSSTPRPPQANTATPADTISQSVALGSPYHNPSPTSCVATTSASPAPSTQIGPNEPLAHEVGLLSLANSKESKYIGPSSGVSFARLIFSAIPQSQGVSTSWATPKSITRHEVAQPFPPDWTPEIDLQNFVDAYFETYQPLYPFLDEDEVTDHLEFLLTRPPSSHHSVRMPRLSEVEASLPLAHSVQVFLILALGARILEARISADFSSERYLATAMHRIGGLALHDSIDGLQLMLLLTLSSFCFEDGPNAWFLTSNIIASCLDLGFQRRWTSATAGLSPGKQNQAIHRNNIRRGIFWSAYSIERTLAVVLGRPLTLRDEAIDVEFPGQGDPTPISPLTENSTALGSSGDRRGEPSFKRSRIIVSPYTVSQYSFRFDQLVAEMKLMLYRVVNLPDRFPWPKDINEWQKQMHIHCDQLLEDLLRELRWRSRRSTSDSAVKTLELKYHHCLMILHRPSPATPRPSLESLTICYNSAIKTIHINLDLHRFSKLANSWLTAHTVFVSGITFLYCLWIKPEMKSVTALDTFLTNAAACTTLLRFLGKTWTIAADAVNKFERLVQLTQNSWGPNLDDSSTEVAASHSLLSMAQSQDSDNLQSGRVDDERSGPFAREYDEPTLADSFTTCTNGFEVAPESFYYELGDMSAWFDLNWLVNATSGEMTAFP
jgi:hypothetical protein